MDKQVIEELIGIMDYAHLTALRVHDGDFSVELERNQPSLGAQELPDVAQRVAVLLAGNTANTPLPQTGEEEATPSDGSIYVQSPMVGMFYASPSPDEDPYVKPGQEVIAGQTLAIIEAMKMMNEITAPQSGVVTEVLAANGTQVEYDQPLFRIMPA